MSTAEHRTDTMRSGDVALFYRAFGQRGATPILIVHGLSYFSYDWIDIAATLSAGVSGAAEPPMSVRTQPG